MNKKAIISVIAIILLIVGGVMFFTHKKSQPIALIQPPMPQTQIIPYVPAIADGMEKENGSCFANSIAIPYRSDAWRCSVGNSISDPCFAIPNTNGTVSKLVCDPNPAEQPKIMPFVLSLTQPLPAAQDTETATAPWGWLIKLADGTICSPFTGTRQIMSDGTPTTYGCNNPKADTVFGDLTDTGNGTWSATVGTISMPKSPNDLPTVLSSQTVIVQTVWQ